MDKQALIAKWTLSAEQLDKTILDSTMDYHSVASTRDMILGKAISEATVRNIIESKKLYVKKPCSHCIECDRPDINCSICKGEGYLFIPLADLEER